MKQPLVSIIVAMDQTRGIGKDNKVPWHIKEDLMHLKKLTLGKTVLLGRKTYDSMTGYYDRSGRPMPGKIYIVITRNTEYQPASENAQVANSLQEALAIAGKHHEEEVFVIGGQQIFTEALPQTQKLYITHVKGTYDTDTFFPQVDLSQWQIKKKEDYPGFSFITYEKKDTVHR